MLFINGHFQEMCNVCVCMRAELMKNVNGVTYLPTYLPTYPYLKFSIIFYLFCLVAFYLFFSYNPICFSCYSISFCLVILSISLCYSFSIMLYPFSLVILPLPLLHFDLFYLFLSGCYISFCLGIYLFLSGCYISFSCCIPSVSYCFLLMFSLLMFSCACVSSSCLLCYWEMPLL